MLEVDPDAVETVGDRRAARAALGPVRAEHESGRASSWSPASSSGSPNRRYTAGSGSAALAVWLRSIYISMQAAGFAAHMLRSRACQCTSRLRTSAGL